MAKEKTAQKQPQIQKPKRDGAALLKAKRLRKKQNGTIRAARRKLTCPKYAKRAAKLIEKNERRKQARQIERQNRQRFRQETEEARRKLEAQGTPAPAPRGGPRKPFTKPGGKPGGGYKGKNPRPRGPRPQRDDITIIAS